MWNFLQRSILESAHLETWKLEFGVPPRTHSVDASETRKLGMWNFQKSFLESARLETWNLEFGVPLQTHGGAPETWNNSECGSCRGVSWRICTLGNMESGIWGFRAASVQGDHAA